METLSDFHFLHPWWLLALVPAVMVYLSLRQEQEVTSQWSKIIAPKLLPYLVVKEAEGEQRRPYRFLVAALVIMTLALAGPTWLREPSPFSENEAPLVVAVDLSESMNVTDVQPSRLERAQQKIHDLLVQRRGGRTALVAYAGSAHLVLPLTEDVTVLESYLADFSTEIMPLPGKAPGQALHLAEKILEKETIPGSILFVTDGIGVEQTSAFVEHHRQSQNEVVVLGIGTVQGGQIPGKTGDLGMSRLDRKGLDEIATQANAYVTEVTTDNTDVRRLNKHIQQHLIQAQAAESDQWQDFGYWLLFPLAIIMLFWARRGWTVQWMVGLILSLVFVHPQTALASEFSEFNPLAQFSVPQFTKQDFINLWLTPDQQGRTLFEQGDYLEAAERFESPLWKGISYYVAEDFENAIGQFSQLETPESYIVQGNAYAHTEAYQDAIDRYDIALALRPDDAIAQNNRDVVEAALAKEKEYQKERSEQGATEEGADQIVFDDTPSPENDENAKQIQIGTQAIDLSDADLTALWLTNVQTTPADFLKQKFQFQLQAEAEDNE